MGGAIGGIGNTLGTIGRGVGSATTTAASAVGTGVKDAGGKIVDLLKPTVNSDGEKVPSKLQQALGNGLAKGSQTYQQQQNTLNRPAGQQAQFSIPDTTLPPDFFAGLDQPLQPRPQITPQQQASFIPPATMSSRVNPNLFYGG